MKLRRLVPIAAALGSLVLPAAASGGGPPTVFVDRDTGSDTGTCGDTVATACATIGQGLTRAQSNATVAVDDSPNAYAESVTVSNGKSLRAQELVGGAEGSTVIDAGSTFDGAVNVAVSGAGQISWFTIRGGGIPVEIAGPVDVNNNRFDDSADTPSGEVRVIASPASAITIQDNTFVDSATAPSDLGILVLSGDPVIDDNDLSGYDTAIEVSGSLGDPIATVVDNTVTGAHGPATGAIRVVNDGQAILTHNHVSAPAAGQESVAVSVIENTASVPITAAFLRRNTLTGHPIGVQLTDVAGGWVELDSDLIVSSSTFGVSIEDVNTLEAGDSIQLINVTLADNATDIRLVDAEVELDSAIVEDAIAREGATTSCTIAFSRGPTTTGDACQTFQTSASPGFAAAGDYHLASGSAMIDAGNPAAPADGTLDIDGDQRALDGDGDCVARRDIGADERGAAAVDCTPPETTITDGPPSLVTTRRRRARAKFTFISSEVGSFKCSLDGKPFKSCNSPETVSVPAKRKAKKHRFAVRATDPNGNTDPDPATRVWRVKRKG